MTSGIILIWSGAIVDIPSGYHLCDGTNGTPDLRDKFIVGAGSTYNPGDNGGNLTHQHTLNCDQHRHALPEPGSIGSGAYRSYQTNYVVVTGTTDTKDHKPPYYSLAYIMKT